jgi:hypothetical protein
MFGFGRYPWFRSSSVQLAVQRFVPTREIAEVATVSVGILMYAKQRRLKNSRNLKDDTKPQEPPLLGVIGSRSFSHMKPPWRIL